MEHSQKPAQKQQMEQYFSTLPAYIQESIRQSGTRFDNVEQMRSLVSNLSGKC